MPEEGNIPTANIFDKLKESILPGSGHKSEVNKVVQLSLSLGNITSHPLLDNVGLEGDQIPEGGVTLDQGVSSNDDQCIQLSPSLVTASEVVVQKGAHGSDASGSTDMLLSVKQDLLKSGLDHPATPLNQEESGEDHTGLSQEQF